MALFPGPVPQTPRKASARTQNNDCKQEQHHNHACSLNTSSMNHVVNSLLGSSNIIYDIMHVGVGSKFQDSCLTIGSQHNNRLDPKRFW
eukprot:5925983-Heterocapsa_arctica.AAC.1